MSKELKIKRALLSVTDKTNIVALARSLQSIGCEIISTGGTAKVLGEAGITYTEISKVTGNPEAFGGRMKTISFAIESALLYDREKDIEEADRLGITPIDLVACNLYPFEAYQKAGTALDELIHYIDIGGPTMIRAAAKNFAFVTVLTDPLDYPGLIKELRDTGGSISYDTRKELMAKAFNLTADYDSAIAQAMDAFCDRKSVRLSLTGGKTLRYGENSHQSAAFYRLSASDSSLYDIKTVNGIELSYNNILDLQAAVEAVSVLNDSACVIVKHNNPCGMAESDSLRTSLELAWAGDPVSAYGGIIAFNKEVKLADITSLNMTTRTKRRRNSLKLLQRLPTRKMR
jgi:phosphoribosylaminoimidazolecarboxamide formyltransferase/IMP cyclohydrolase